MPRILEFVPLENGRLAVVLDVPPTQADQGSVTLWTEEERRREIRSAVLAEREACAQIALAKQLDDYAHDFYASAACANTICNAIRAQKD